MNILKYVMVLLILSMGAKAQNALQSEAEKIYEEEMSLALCRSVDHHFDSNSNACMYCALGLTYDANKLNCIGVPNRLGKCLVKDHYHAKTQECMYCAKGYQFHEDIRECLIEQDNEKKGE